MTLGASLTQSGACQSPSLDPKGLISSVLVSLLLQLVHCLPLLSCVL